MSIQIDRRLLKVIPDFANIVQKDKQGAYKILRENPELVVKLGPRQIRVDPAKLQEWIGRGGAKS